MRFGITSKLFATILVTNVAIAVAFGAAMQYSVNRGFRDYVEEREMRRLQQLAAAFTIAYAQHRNWDFVRESEDEWRRLRGSDRPTRVRRGGDPPASLSAPNRLPARPDDPVDPRRSDGERQRGAPLPLTLLDAQRKIVRGSALRPSGPALSVPVMIDGVAVGFVAVPELPYGGDDDQFLQQQLRMSWIIGGVAILLAAGVSVLLARGFLAPIRRLARATHRLAAGDYAQRISVGRRGAASVHHWALRGCSSPRLPGCDRSSARVDRGDGRVGRQPVHRAQAGRAGCAGHCHTRGERHARARHACAEDRRAAEIAARRGRDHE